MKYVLSRKLFEKKESEKDITSLLNNINNSCEELKEFIHSSKSYLERYSPTKKLEDELGITGISKIYSIPFGLSEEELENLNDIVVDNKKMIQMLFDELLKLNPELEIFKNYKYTSKKFKYPQGGVIGGACSRMNIDDIKDYIDNGTEMLDSPKWAESKAKEYKFKRTDKKAKEYSETYAELCSKGVEPTWFPSMKTLNYIINNI